jgi:MFS family permease
MRPPKHGKPFFIRSSSPGWVLEGVIEPIRVARINRASFLCVTANSEHVVEFLISEFIDAFRSMPGNIHTNLFHHDHSMLLGLGTATVYPSLLAAVSDVAHPVWRVQSLSVYRSWRDFGYAAGAAIAGVVAGALGLAWSIHVAGLQTFVSGVIAWVTVGESRRAAFGVNSVNLPDLT